MPFEDDFGNGGLGNRLGCRRRRWGNLWGHGLADLSAYFVKDRRGDFVQQFAEAGPDDVPRIGGKRDGNEGWGCHRHIPET